MFAYLFARHTNGTFILRIEDTDRKRSKKEYEANILETLDWLELTPDAIHHQSEWVGEHEFILRSLVERDIAYVSREKSPEGEEKEIIRFRNPNKTVTFTDVVRGDITTDTTELGDFVIAKSFTEPVFHLANVVDDALTGVTHIIRGDDHISNTPRQTLIYEALGAHLPQYVHLPLVLAPDRSKLSKRKGAKALLQYRDSGYLPSAILNYLAVLGWHPGTDEELFTRKELIERFDLSQIQKSGAIFDEMKLRWFNREHLHTLDDEQFAEAARPFFSDVEFTKSNGFERFIPELRERIETFGDIRAMEAAGEFAYYTEAPTYEIQNLLWKKAPDISATVKRLRKVLELLEPVSREAWSAESIKGALWSFAEAEGKGEALWPVRYALTGQEKSPDPFTVAGILGRDESLQRIKTAIAKLEG